MNTIGIEKHGSKITELQQDTLPYISDIFVWWFGIHRYISSIEILASILAVISSAIFDWCNSTYQKETKVAF